MPSLHGLDPSLEDRLHRPGTPGFARLNRAMVMAGLAAFGILYAAQPVLPQLSDEFSVSPGTASLAVSASTGALALTVVPATALALRFGRVRAMRGGLLLAVLLTLLGAAAPTFEVLVVLRALTGVALAGVIAVAMGHVGAEVHPRGLGSAMGLYVAGNTFGGVGGRLVSSLSADVAGWRWATVVLALGGLLATAAFWRWLPEPVADVGSPAGPPPRDPDVLRPHAFRALLTDPLVLAMVVVPFVLMGGFVAVYNYLTFRLVGAPFDFSSALVGLVFLAYLAGSVSSTVAGRLSDRVGRPVVLVAGVVVMLLGLALTVPDQVVFVVGGLVVFTAGFFAAHATVSGWAPVVGRRHGTQASALYVCAYYLGSSIFGALIGESWKSGGWSSVALDVGLLTMVGLAASGVLIAGMRRRTAADARSAAASAQTSTVPPVRQ